jgi:hypothetical protein
MNLSRFPRGRYTATQALIEQEAICTGWPWKQRH